MYTKLKKGTKLDYKGRKAKIIQMDDIIVIIKLLDTGEIKYILKEDIDANIF